MLFPWYIKYPNQNDEILNLDWILSTIDNLVNEVANFVSLNTIKYADPIQWNITTQYEKNTVVIDPITGSAYISTKPVPAGVGLNNTDYWNIIFTLDVISANKNITLRDDANNILATFESEVDDWLLWQGTLYIVTRDIEIGQSYVVGYNIDRYTVERFLKEYISNLKTYVDTTIGDLDELDTSDKSDVVAAINSILNDVSTIIGDLADLETTDKDSVVDAINELVGLISDITDNIGNLVDLDTTNKNSLVAAINEVVGNIGDLDDLDTTNKNSLVAAINEVFSSSDENVVYIEDYGAVGDGSTDDTQSFLNAISNCPTYGTVRNRKKGATYKLTSTVAINKRLNFIIDAQINYYGTGVCIDIMPTLAEQFSHCTVYIKSMVDANGNSTTPSSVNRFGTIGIRVSNMISSTLIVNNIQRFTFAGVYFNTNGDLSGNVHQIILHNYFSFNTVANCGFGIYMISADAATSCTQANEFHIIWLLQCFSCLVVDETSANISSDSNLFFITAIDNNYASGHGIIINGRWNIFKIGFMSTDIFFDSGSGYNSIEIGNNISTDVTIYYGGVKNSVITATPTTLPSSFTPVSNTVYQNTFGVPVEININAYASTSGTKGLIEIQVCDDGISWIAAQKLLVSGDTDASYYTGASQIIPAGCYYRLIFTNATPKKLFVNRVL